ncbi:MAG: ArdC family protein [Syntrophales bacterium]|nr:ArdC family protein [Syntrophales bacterium]
MKTSKLNEKYQGYLQTLIEEIKDQKSDKVILHYLDFCSRFHRYSISNQILIWMAMPNAEMTAGFHAWKKLGRTIKKGEKGIPIFAPIWVKQKPKTRDAADNEEVVEESEEDNTERKKMFFKVVYVFDVSQTEGAPLAESPDIININGSAETGLLGRLEEYTSAEGIELNYVDELGGALGVSMGGQIKILSSLTNTQRFHALVHELAHEHLHKGMERRQYSKKLKETEAEAAAYVVCRHFRLKPRSATYLATYQTEDVDIQGSFDRITKTASRILTGMESVQASLRKAA